MLKNPLTSSQIQFRWEICSREKHWLHKCCVWLIKYIHLWSKLLVYFWVLSQKLLHGTSISRHICKIAKRKCYLRHVCPSIRVEQLGCHWMDFHEIWYLSIVQKSVKKIQVLLKSDKNDRYFIWRPMYIYDSISPIYSWNEKCFGQKL